jgi:hypothetical protein
LVWLSEPDHGQCDLTLRALVPGEATRKPLSVRVTLDGRIVASVQPTAGELLIQVRVSGDGKRHEIGILASPTFQLSSRDRRPGSIRIRYVGFE